MPYRVWSVGQELLAADLQQYIQDQAVNSFASAAARDAAIPLPVPGMAAFLVDVKALTIYEGTAWKSYAPDMPVQSLASVYGNAGGTSSTAFVALPVPLTTTYTKRRANTWVTVQVTGHLGIDDAGTYAYIGVSLNGAAAAEADQIYGQGVHTVAGTIRTLPGGAVGPHTLTVQWKVSGTGVVASMYGKWSLLVTESYQ